MSSNLNNRVCHADSISVQKNCKTTVYFENLQQIVCAAIMEADCVVGCVAWVRCKKIISALMQRPCMLLVTSDRVHRANRAAFGNLTPIPGLCRQACSIVGTARGKFRPLMHNKFLVLLRKNKPYAVLTGSFNFTVHSSSNLENIVRIDNKEIAECYYSEAKAISEIARPV